MEVVAKLIGAVRKRLQKHSGTQSHDDHVVCLIVKIVQGPISWLDRRIRVEIGVDEFVDSLPEAVKITLRAALTDKQDLS